MDMPNEGSWDKDPVRYGRLTAIEGRVYTRPCKAKNNDVLLRIPETTMFGTRCREISMTLAHLSEICN